MAKLFLHPSTYEGFGIVCIEALYSGCRVISFVKPMKAEIKNWHFATSKEEMIRKAIEVLRNPQVKYETVVPYTIDQTVSSFSQLFSLQNV